MAKAQLKQIKKEIFSWEGINKEGKKVVGQTTSGNIDMVKADLRRQGIVPKKVKKKSKSAASSKKITTGDIAIFARQLATMMRAGVPLVQSFDITGQGHSNPSMRELILTIKADVEAGGTFASALKKHPLYFDDLFCNLVEAGEQSGALESLLDKIATYKEKTEALKTKIKKALTYPIAVIVVAFIVTAILLIFVVPTFADMFKNFGAELPLLTQFVVNLSNAFVANWYFIFGGVIGSVIAFVQSYKRSPKLRAYLDQLAIKLPITADLTIKSSVARFARTLSTMFAAGVPLVEAMESVAGASGNSVYKNAILKIRDDISGGSQLQASMNQFPQLFPNMVIQMVAIGEESGALDTMLGKVADYFEEQVDAAVDSLTSLMEPFIMVFLAIVVGGLVIAMYLPIFKMGEVV
ncbi:MAG: type II secretion system F family protein [Gammaproteobacteria bacterium]|nr:MAG: type II secretion system F family protein [Gammaproteobacteria bacterium]